MRPEELPPPATPPEDIRRAAEEILARREFQEPPKTLYERIVEAMSEALDEAVQTLFEGGRSALAAWIALAVIVGVTGFLVTRIAAAIRPNATARDAVVVTTERSRRAIDWDRQADEHAAAGQWRDAVRCRYRALVARLASKGVVDDIAGRTAGEHRLDVRGARPEAAPAFDAASSVFERAWYGPYDTTPAEHDALVRAAGSIDGTAAP